MAGFDFENEGVFLSAIESGDVNTFSERIHIKKEKIQQR
jgi:hypothetical protein